MLPPTAHQSCFILESYAYGSKNSTFMSENLQLEIYELWYTLDSHLILAIRPVPGNWGKLLLSSEKLVWFVTTVGLKCSG